MYLELKTVHHLGLQGEKKIAKFRIQKHFCESGTVEWSHNGAIWSVLRVVH